MWPKSPKRVLRIALPTIAALGAGTAVGVAAIPSADGTIHACIATADGAARIVDADTTPTCPAGQTAITWNQQGPAGPAGPPGPQGATGDSGTGAGSSPSKDTFSTPTQAGGPSADMFLKLDGIQGESTDDKHAKEIDLTSFAFAVGRGADGTGTSAPAPGATATAPAATGAAASKGRLQTLRIDKIYDAASPKLFRAAATGQRIKSAVLTFRRSNDSDVEFLTYTLTDVQVTSYDQGGRDGDARDLGSLEEEVGLTAAKVRVTEQTIGSDGKKGPVVKADWTLPKAGGAKK